MSPTNFTRWIVRISLVLLGIFDDRIYSILCCIIMTISTSISVFGSIIGFLNSVGTIDRLESFTAISPQLNTLLVFLSVNASGPKLKHLLRQLAGDNVHIANVIDQTDASVKKKLSWLTAIIIIQVIFFTVPVLIFSIRQDSIDDKYSLVIPYWFSCGNHASHNKLQSICVRWKIKSKKLLFAINALQAGGVISLNIIYFAAFSLYIIIMEELTSHLGCIKSKLGNLSKKISESNLQFLETNCAKLSTRMSLQEDEISEDFLFAYQYQQFLDKCLSETISAWNGFISFFYINFGINTTLFIFVIFYELNSNVFFLTTKMGLLGVTLFVMAFIVANHAQNVANMKEEIINELRNVPWYKMNIKFRKIYLITLLLNCTPTSVKIADMYDVNLGSFGSMVKAAYSICNMLILKFVK